ncbi:hypothetical protein [Flavobacterium sp.]|uniref:hypothetical protein n=1 Tax=Flavobacterium sp. TaxID=239 RepID=UPI0025B902B8|nr:hypothetical protein [Flavobacterium sp.]
MNWEDLKYYKPIEKAELAKAKKTIENVIAANLAPFGFQKFGRKLIRKSNDVIHLIHLDSRGSWSGSSNSMKTEFAVISIYDTDILVKNYEPISGSRIEDLAPKLKNYYQITQEFELFADYLSKKIIEIIVPYFDKYRSSEDVLAKGITFGATKNLMQLCLASDAKNPDDNADLKVRKDAVFGKFKFRE